MQTTAGRTSDAVRAFILARSRERNLFDHPLIGLSLSGNRSPTICKTIYLCDLRAMIRAAIVAANNLIVHSAAVFVEHFVTFVHDNFNHRRPTFSFALSTMPWHSRHVHF